MWTLLLATAEAAAQPPSWWEVVAGIVAIPVALIGLVYTWFVIKKTRLESRKTELEIAEREQKLAAATGAEPSLEIAQIVAQPIAEAARSQELVIRFIQFILTFGAWWVIGEATMFMQLPAAALAQVGLLWLGAAIFLLVAIVPIYGAALTVSGLGFPLITQLVAHSGTRPPRFVRWATDSTSGRWVVTIAVMLILLQRITPGW